MTVHGLGVRWAVRPGSIVERWIPNIPIDKRWNSLRDFDKLSYRQREERKEGPEGEASHFSKEYVR